MEKLSSSNDSNFSQVRNFNLEDKKFDLPPLKKSESLNLPLSVISEKSSLDASEQ